MRGAPACEAPVEVQALFSGSYMEVCVSSSSVSQHSVGQIKGFLDLHCFTLRFMSVPYTLKHFYISDHMNGSVAGEGLVPEVDLLEAELRAISDFERWRDDMVKASPKVQNLMGVLHLLWLVPPKSVEPGRRAWMCMGSKV